MDTAEAGRKGGQTTLKKYGKEYFVQLRKKSRGRLIQKDVLDKPLLK